MQSLQPTSKFWLKPCVSNFYLLFSISHSKLHDYLSHESIGQGILQRCPVTVLIQESRIVMIIYKASEH